MYGTVSSIDPGRTESTFALICVCIWSCYLCDAVWRRNLTLMRCPHAMPTMPVRLCSSHVWNGAVLTLDAWWTGSMFGFVLMCVWIWSWHGCSMQYDVAISPWCAVQTHYYDGDNVMFIECMHDNMSCWLCTTRRCVCVCMCVYVLCTYVCVYAWVLVCAWIWMCYSCSMQCEVVMSSWCTNQIHYIGDGRFASTFVERCYYVGLDEQEVSLYWSVFGFEHVIRVRCEVVTLIMLWCAV